MKILAGIVLAMAPLSLLPSAPAPSSSALGATSRSTDSLSLLPGPSLLSPARGAPQSSASVGIAPAGHGYFTFVPGKPGEEPASARRRLELRPTSVPSHPTAPFRGPPAGALRFENTLEPTPTQLPKARKV